MWNQPALLLIFLTAVGLFFVSLLLAKRETVDELRYLFDRRILGRAARSAVRFRIGTLLWLTTYVAVVIPTFQTFRDLPVVFLVIPMLTVAFLLARVAWSSLTDPTVRRVQPPRRFESSVDQEKY